MRVLETGLPGGVMKNRFFIVHDVGYSLSESVSFTLFPGICMGKLTNHYFENCIQYFQNLYRNNLIKKQFNQNKRYTGSKSCSTHHPKDYTCQDPSFCG